MGIFFQVFPRKPAIFKFWTNFKGSHLNKKLMVVAWTQGDNPLIFSSYPATRIFRLSPWIMATTLNFFFAFFWQQEKNWESSPWVTATTLNFFFAFFWQQEKNWESSPWVTATTLNFFYCLFLATRKKNESRRHESRRWPSTLLFWSLPLTMIHKTWIFHVL